MPHAPKPFYKQSRNAWYVQIGSRQYNLGPQPENSPPPRKSERTRQWNPPKEILDAFDLMKQELKEQGNAPLQQSDVHLVSVILDRYLDWCQKYKAGRTYDWYRNYLQTFLDTLPVGLVVKDLYPFHVQEWLNGKPQWKTGERGAITAVQRALNWAAKLGHISKNPIRGMERPEAGHRELFLTPEQFLALCNKVKDRDFLDVLETCWDTGCRPNELMVVEAGFVDLPGGRWIFPIEKSKGKKRQRVVYLTDRALEITRRRAQEVRRGPIFRNTDGRPWTRYALNCRFHRLKEKTGIACSLYALRHSWATRMLSSGQTDAVTCSLLLGHRDTTMIARFYSHLTHLPEYLRNAAKKAEGA